MREDSRAPNRGVGGSRCNAEVWPRRDEALRREKCVKKGHGKGHENVPFWVLNGLSEIETTLLE